jgi:hypothetical protein
MAVTIDGTTGITAPAIDVATPLDVADIPSLPASQITSGTVATARLGSGTADSTTFLRGDQSWATVSTTPTTEQVLNATAGASAGAVGTYAVLMHIQTSANIAIGSTVAGSSLRAHGFRTSSDPNSTSINTSISGTASNAAMSGTWRALGRVVGTPGDFETVNAWGGALFLRIS